MDFMALLPYLVQFLVPLLACAILFRLVFVFAKHRSATSAFFFFLFLSAIATFIMSDKQIMEQISALEYGLSSAVSSILLLFGLFTTNLHLCFVNLVNYLLVTFELDPGFISEVIKILTNSWFLLITYFVYFLLAFLIFKQRKRRRKTYSDYDD